MPTYLYKCQNQECSEYDVEKTVVKRMTAPNPVCEQSGDEMVQVFKRAVNFKLKGDGWTGSNITGKR